MSPAVSTAREKGTDQGINLWTPGDTTWMTDGLSTATVCNSDGLCTAVDDRARLNDHGEQAIREVVPNSQPLLLLTVVQRTTNEEGSGS